MSKLKWNDTRAFFLPGSVRSDMTDKEFEILRAKMLVARDIVKNIGLPIFPKGIEGQIVELELLWEREDRRTLLDLDVIFSFDHLCDTNC